MSKKKRMIVVGDDEQPERELVVRSVEQAHDIHDDMGHAGKLKLPDGEDPVMRDKFAVLVQAAKKEGKVKSPEDLDGE